MKKLLASLLFLLGASPAFSGPVVNNASVTGFVRKAAITITGSSLDSKSPAGPEIYTDFEDDIFPSSYSVLSSTWSQIENVARTNSCPAGIENSTWCVTGTFPGTSGSHDMSFAINKSFWTEIHDYGFRYFAFSGPPSGSGLKEYRINQLAGNNDFVMTQNASDPGIAFNECALGINRYAYFSFLSNAWGYEQHTWTHGADVACSGDDATDGGTWNFKRNGVTVQNITNHCNCDSDIKELRVFDNYEADGVLNGQTVYMTMFYIDSVKNVVEFSTTSTYALSTRKVPQPATAWSSTSITAALNTKGLDLSKTIYAYVTDSSGNTNANGVVVSFAGGSGLTNLSAAVATVNVATFSVTWSSVPAASANFMAAMSTSSDFVPTLASGTLINNVTSYAALGTRTTYYFKVGISTEGAYNSSISTLTLWTDLLPSFSGITASGMTMNWTSVPGANSIAVLANDSAFTSIVSSVSASGNSNAFTGLSGSTQYWGEVKLSTQTNSYTQPPISANTAAVVNNTVPPAVGKIRFQGVTIRKVRTQ